MNWTMADVAAIAGAGLVGLAVAAKCDWRKPDAPAMEKEEKEMVEPFAAHLRIERPSSHLALGRQRTLEVEHDAPRAAAYTTASARRPVFPPTWQTTGEGEWVVEGKSVVWREKKFVYDPTNGTVSVSDIWRVKQ